MKYTLFILMVIAMSCEKHIAIDPLVGTWTIKFYKQHGQNHSGIGTITFANRQFIRDGKACDYEANGKQLHLNGSYCWVDYRLSGDTLIVNYLLDEYATYGSCLYHDIIGQTYLIRGTDTISTQ